MKKNVIRFFSLLLVLAMVLSVIAPLSWAAEVQEEQQAESSMSDSPAESSPEEESDLDITDLMAGAPDWFSNGVALFLAMPLFVWYIVFISKAARRFW